jgi:Mg2+-importing ATPase
MLAKANHNKICVSPAVLAAASKDEEDLFQSLRTTPEGLTQFQAEERARTAGPNEVTPEHRQGWVMRLLKIVRNPLVILLTALSAISFATGDARAGTVMAGMVLLSVALRFWQEARADAPAAKLNAMIHVSATVLRDGTPAATDKRMANQLKLFLETIEPDVGTGHCLPSRCINASRF